MPATLSWLAIPRLHRHTARIVLPANLMAGRTLVTFPPGAGALENSTVTSPRWNAETIESRTEPCGMSCFANHEPWYAELDWTWRKILPSSGRMRRLGRLTPNAVRAGGSVQTRRPG